jgi:PAS domain S-box-containing protein
LSQALRERDQNVDLLRRQMSQFFEATTDAIFFLDREYRFTFLNRRAYELLGPSGDILGTNLFESFPAASVQGSPFLQNYRETMELGAFREFEAFYPDPLNIWVRVQSHPVEDGIMVYFRDVTTEKAGQEALRRKNEEAERQHAEIETLYRTAPIGLALFDVEEYRYLRLNERQAAFFGLKPEQVLGSTLTDLAPIEGLKELFDQVRRGEPVINYPLEGTLITDPDVYRYWLVSYFPVYALDGSIQAITAASLEITQQKKAEQALIETEKLAVVGRLASSIAHEINNPLEAVTNLLYLARLSSDLNEVREYLGTADRELHRAAAVTSQTLRFHKQATSPQAVTAEALMQGVLPVFQARLVNSRITVLPRSRATDAVRCFEGEIRQVLSNLVGNAIDAMSSDGGRLLLRDRVSTRWSDGSRGVVLTVADTGTGMSEHTQAKLYQAFYTTKGITGTGLGLWVSKEIIDRHHGYLRVRSSQRPGHHGTVFAIFLPFDAVTRPNQAEDDLATI